MLEFRDAVRAGILISEGEIVLFFDGDLDISPHEINTYIKELEECHLVIASKAHPISEVTCPASRRFLSKAYSLLVRRVVGIKLRYSIRPERRKWNCIEKNFRNHAR